MGALGLVAVKNLVEEGFDVTGFERNDYVGGLWKYTEEEKTSVLMCLFASDLALKLKFDFALSHNHQHIKAKGTDSYPNGVEVQQYLEDYVKYFGLEKHIRLSTVVNHITRNHESNQWAVHLLHSKEEYFDKVVIATGTNFIPKIPTLEGLDQFHGQALHSQTFKNPSKFQGKDVLIVGFSNSAADTATQLVGYANTICISHRQGAIILPRYSDGRPIDHGLTMRLMATQNFLNQYFPHMAENMFNKFAKSLQDRNFKIKAEWNFSPTPSLKQSLPIVSDELVDCLESGKIKSVPALRRVAGGRMVELIDGTLITADCIIWCTGYKASYEILDEDLNPTRNTTAAWTAAPGSNEKPLPRLYQNLFSLQEPQSLVFLGATTFPSPAFQLYDLATMAVAQVWKGNSSLPSKEDMERAVDAHHDWVCSLAQRATVYPGIVKPGPWMTWVNDAAGTGVNEMLGYGMAGWKFWWREKNFCRMLMDGICSPHIYRLFDGKRKRWDGAKNAILKANNAKN